MSFSAKGRIKTLSFLLIAVVLAIVLYFIFRVSPGSESHFKRHRFMPADKSDALQFNSRDYNWGIKSKPLDRLSKSIARGTGIRVKGKGSLVLKPGLRGTKGIFFPVVSGGLDKSEIRVSVSIKRSHDFESVEVEEYKRVKSYHTISRVLEFEKNDEILVEAKGNGYLIVGDPVVYDLIDKEKRKYVFVIALDTLRWDKVGLKKGNTALTPNLDAFKRDAVTFANAYAQGSWTLPSFMSLFTGLYEYHHGVVKKTHLEASKPYFMQEISSRFLTASINGGMWLGAKYGHSRGVDFITRSSGTKDKDGGRKMFHAGIDFLEKNPAPESFLFLHTYQVHSPYEPPVEFLEKEQLEHVKKLDTFFFHKQYWNAVEPDTREAMEKLYETEILAFDCYFGEFVRYLKAKGIYERSMIVFLSDHGEEFFEHKGWAHGHSLYNEVIKVPLLVKFPGNEHGNRVIDEAAGLVDVFPTLLDYFDIETGSRCDGVSLLPLLRNGKPARKRLMASTYTCPFALNIPPRFAIFFDDYKLIYNYTFKDSEKEYFASYGLPPVTGGMELFDLRDDPGERHNLLPGKKHLLKGLGVEIGKIINRINFNMKQDRKGTVTFDAREQAQLKTLGYL